MFTGASFTIGNAQKQSKCLSTYDWIKNMWYKYIMKYYSAIKRGNIAIGNNMDGS